VGFRNRLATALETGSRAPGVRIYASGSNPSSGIVEWHAGPAIARGTLTSSDTGSGGQFYSLGLSGGPSLALNVEEQPAGGTLKVARITADKLYAGPTAARELGDTGWTSLTPVAPWVRGADGMNYRIVDGLCYFQVHATYPTPPYPAGSWVTTLPVAPTKTHWFPDVWAETLSEVKVNPNGTLTLTTSKSLGGVVVSGSFPVG
jgi:hypothetical protein